MGKLSSGDNIVECLCEAVVSTPVGWVLFLHDIVYFLFSFCVQAFLQKVGFQFGSGGILNQCPDMEEGALRIHVYN